MAKKKFAPGNKSQQNQNAFGATERGFKPNTLKKVPSQSGRTGGLSERGSRPPMYGGGANGGGQYSNNMGRGAGGMMGGGGGSRLPPLPQIRQSK